MQHELHTIRSSSAAQPLGPVCWMSGEGPVYGPDWALCERIGPYAASPGPCVAITGPTTLLFRLWAPESALFQLCPDPRTLIGPHMLDLVCGAMLSAKLPMSPGEWPLLAHHHIFEPVGSLAGQIIWLHRPDLVHHSRVHLFTIQGLITPALQHTSSNICTLPDHYTPSKGQSRNEVVNYQNSWQRSPSVTKMCVWDIRQTQYFM